MGPTLHTINPPSKLLFLLSIEAKQATQRALTQLAKTHMASLISIPISLQVICRAFIHVSLLLLFVPPLSNSQSIHDLLRSRGLPAGLFPRDVKSYDLDQDGLLQVHMGEPCMAKFESRVLFDTIVRANLSYGGLIGLEGLTQEELFLWLPVKDIIVDDPSSGLILFDIGVAHKQFSLSLFEDPPVCNPQGVLMEQFGEEELGIQA